MVEGDDIEITTAALKGSAWTEAAVTLAYDPYVRIDLSDTGLYQVVRSRQ
jgi:hypothetical protein